VLGSQDARRDRSIDVISVDAVLLVERVSADASVAWAARTIATSWSTVVGLLVAMFTWPDRLVVRAT
jgi:hypothetical protein